MRTARKPHPWLVAGFAACLGIIALLDWLLPLLSPQFLKSHRGLNALYYNRLLARLPRQLQDQLEADWEIREYSRHAPLPHFTLDTGRVPFQASVAITGEENSVVRYSLDGAIPTVASPRWLQDFTVTAPVLIRAKAFAVGKSPSDTVTRVYLPGMPPSLPIISIAMDPILLDDRRVGIVANATHTGRVWERPGLLSLLPEGEGAALEGEVKVRVHGNTSRLAPRKKLRIRTAPTAVQVKEELRRMVTPEIDGTQHWVLHVPGSMFEIYRERLGNRIAREMGVPTPPAVPCLLFVNGKPWGVYDLMPRLDEYLVAGRADVAGVTLLRGNIANPVLAAGDSSAWRELHQLVEESDLREDSAYQLVASAVDLDNFINCWIFFIYAGDYDRPQFNSVLFLDPKEANRWQFLSYDVGLGFNRYGTLLEHDTLAWHLRDEPRPDLKPYGTPDNPGYVRATLFFRRLMAREDFRQRFRARFEHYLEGILSSGRTLSIFDGILQEVASVLDWELAGYPNLDPTTARKQRELEIARIREFLEARPRIVQRLLAQHLDPEDTLDRPVQDLAAGAPLALRLP